MPGNNHYADCLCGWCVKARNASRQQRAEYIGIRFETFESFVNPNALCPECGAQVFFYQSPYGGRVFFDELGPPWPKHPCTDSPTPSALKSHGARLAGAPREQRRVSWQTDGWHPVSIVRIYLEDEWWVVRVEMIGDGTTMRLLCEERPAFGRGMLIHFGGWDGNGYGTISYLSNSVSVDAVETAVFKYADHVLSPRTEVLLQRAQRNEGKS